MDTIGFFTSEEKKLFFSKYRLLLRNLYSFLEREDIRKMKELMKRVVALDCYGRDKNGINGLLRNIDTALIATLEIGLKRTSVIALLLYRPVLKKAITIEEVEQKFGADVTLIIRRLLKTSDLYARNTAVNSENFHHLLFSFAEDVRVILLMIADRLCLMRMGKQMQEDDRIRLATEASYLYAPLAHRLGLYTIKSELEDLSLKYTDRKQYDFIKRKLNETKRSRDAYIAEFIAPIKRKLAAAGFKFDIKGRTKSIHSINNKLKKQQVEFEGIYDLFAIRIVLDTPLEKERSECWQVYSIVTDMYQPNPKRMKDWISIPKTNGYESLHITVMGPQNKWVEVQIRTKRMDEIAERGLAAHWKYKGVKAESGLDEFLNTVRAALETKENNPLDLMQDFKMDLYKDEIYVFTPTGELIKLAKGATVLDFAFAIHTKLGSKCVSAKVNGKNVPIKYTLNNGDSVSVITSPAQSPKRDWLNFVVTSKARVKIKQALKEAVSEPFEGHAHHLLDRCRGRFAHHGPHGLLGHPARKAQHDQCLQRLIDNPSVGSRRLWAVVVETQRHELAAQLDDDLLRRLEPQSLDILQQDGVPRRDDPLQFARRVGRQDHPRRIAPHARNADQQPEQLTLDLRRETVEQLRILAHDIMNKKLRLCGMLDGRVGFERNVQVVAHSAHVDHGIGRSNLGYRSLNIFVHDRLL